VGALPLAVTDCLNYGDPEDPGVFYEFKEGVRGISDACSGLRVFPGADHGIPVVSGNVSFYNQSETGAAIAPTPIVACAGRIENAARARNQALKAAGSRLFLLGRLHGRMGGSEYEKHFAKEGSHDVPQVDFAEETALVRTLIDAFERGLVEAAHDISHGGVLVAVAEMMLSSEPYPVGASLDLADASVQELFSEYGGVVVEVATENAEAFVALAGSLGAQVSPLGATTESTGLHVSLSGGSFEIPVTELCSVHRGRVEAILYG
jgi:phosphoribosylformylglycinamidine (FGAM) synthase-like enzyme